MNKELKQLKYYLNEDDLGIAFENIFPPDSFDGAFYLTASMEQYGTSIQILDFEMQSTK